MLIFLFVSNNYSIIVIIIAIFNINLFINNNSFEYCNLFESKTYLSNMKIDYEVKNFTVTTTRVNCLSTHISRLKYVKTFY